MGNVKIQPKEIRSSESSYRPLHPGNRHLHPHFHAHFHSYSSQLIHNSPCSSHPSPPSTRISSRVASRVPFRRNHVVQKKGYPEEGWSDLILAKRVFARVCNIQKPILIFVFFIDAAHQRRSRGQHFINEDEDRLFGGQLDAFPDHVDKLTHGQVSGNEVFFFCRWLLYPIFRPFRR